MHSSTIVAYDPSQTHPIDDPFYSLPVIGLHFQKNNKGRGLVCEGAVIIGEFSSYKYCQGMNLALLFLPWTDMSTSEVKRIYKPGIGTLPGNIFRTIKVGLEKEGGGM